LPETIIDLTARVDAELSDIITSRKVPLYRMMSYHMGWSDPQGRSDMLDIPVRQERTHGVLTLLACRAVGGDIEAVLPAAAAVELVNSFTQIHDDVQGGNPQRDNRDAVWWVWGPAQAINAGDGMHALARLALFRLLERGVPSDIVFKAVQIMDAASLETCEGRFLDMEAQERIDLSVDAYMKMAFSKTGALVSCAMTLGALIGSGDEALIEAMGNAGSRLGVAMQVRSDLRELWGDGIPNQPASPEVMNKKKLLPVVYALEKATVSEKRRMGEIYFKRVLEPQDVAKLREVIEQLGAKDACEKLVEQYRAGAIAALDAPGISSEGKAGIEGYINSLLKNRMYKYGLYL
jgi:geranylgeranyl diphosphate synthase type I